MDPFHRFEADLASQGTGAVAAGLIGEGRLIDGPAGPVPLIYCDYVASGRPLRQVEDFVAEHVLPFYANSHTEASFCGSHSTRLREAARAYIAAQLGAGPGVSTIFAGSGATAGINRIVGLFDVAGTVARGGRAVVLVGPYEHHSNILPWRESGAQVVEIAECPEGGPCPDDLEAALIGAAGADLVIGAFSAASNVTGIVADVDAVTARLKAHGALAVWDYAGGGPYLPVAMGDKDALVLSPHKFIGGPGASGVMLVRDAAVRRVSPTLPGGGTVRFVSPWGHAYSGRLVAREEGGTPNVIGDIRAALALAVKAAVGQDRIDARNGALRARAVAAFAGQDRIDLLARDARDALPILSFRVRDGRGGHVHHQLFTRMLSDRCGIQARGGCACAGPYAHRLLGLDRAASDTLNGRIAAGHETEKPGWVRMNLSYLCDDAKADAILAMVCDLALRAPDLAASYGCDPATARYTYRDAPPLVATA